MKLSIKHLFAVCAAAVAMTLGLSSCNSNDNPTPSQQPLLAFMNYEYGTDYGSKFSYQKSCSSPVVSLTASQTFSIDQLPNGSRVVTIFYAPGDTLPSKDTTIELLQIARVPVITPTITEIPTNPEWGPNQINLTLLNLQPNYIDMITTINASEYSKIKYQLLVDQSTINSEVIDMYLVDATEEIDYGQSVQFYASFDISQIRQPDTKVFRIHVSNATVPSASLIKIDAATGEILK